MVPPEHSRHVTLLEVSGWYRKLVIFFLSRRRSKLTLLDGVQGDANRKPRGELFIDEACKIMRADGAATFEILAPKKTYYLTADSIPAMEDWLRVLQVRFTFFGNNVKKCSRL
jgi:hypothetical protein